jgi:hypothetical protein
MRKKRIAYLYHHNDAALMLNFGGLSWACAYRYVVLGPSRPTTWPGARFKIMEHHFGKLRRA